MKKTSALFLSAVVAVSACAGRPASTVKVIQDRDSKMSCAELRQEINVGQQAMSRLMANSEATRSKNTAAAVVGAVVFFPALFFMDLKGADAAEAKAMSDRIQGLATRHNARGCRPHIKIETSEEAAKTAEES